MPPGLMILPRVLEHPKSQTCIPGESIRFVCVTNMLPESSEFSWMFNEKELKNNNIVHISKNELMIQQCDCDIYSGNYSCLVNTPLGRIRSHPAKLQPLDTLEIPYSYRSKKIEIFEMNVIAGSLVILHCLLPSNLPMEGRIFWFTPNGQVFKDSAKYRVTRNLYITNVQSGDSGLYHCSYHNLNLSIMLNDTTKTRVRVIRETEDNSMKTAKDPLLLQPPSAVRVIAGGNLTLECGISPTNNALNIITWEKFGAPLPKTRTYSDNKTGILRILNLTKEDRGTYICKMILHERGFPLMFKSLVEVEEPPQLENNAVSEGIEVLYGSDVKLICPATGKPHPQTTWYFNGRRLDQTKSYVLSGQILSIAPVTHREEGIYQCFAENIHGITSKTFLINLQLSNSFVDADDIVSKHIDEATGNSKEHDEGG
ncbi:hypothetical protein GJ496_004257, partial [Pomphorhynchus laevis]